MDKATKEAVKGLNNKCCSRCGKEAYFETVPRAKGLYVAAYCEGYDCGDIADVIVPCDTFLLEHTVELVPDTQCGVKEREAR